MFLNVIALNLNNAFEICINETHMQSRSYEERLHENKIQNITYP